MAAIRPSCSQSGDRHGFKIPFSLPCSLLLHGRANRQYLKVRGMRCVVCNYCCFPSLHRSMALDCKQIAFCGLCESAGCILMGPMMVKLQVQQLQNLTSLAQWPSSWLPRPSPSHLQSLSFHLRASLRHPSSSRPPTQSLLLPESPQAKSRSRIRTLLPSQRRAAGVPGGRRYPARMRPTGARSKLDRQWRSQSRKRRARRTEP